MSAYIEYRTRWSKATKRAHAEGRRRGAPVTWQLARIQGQLWLTLMGVYPPRGTGWNQ